MDQKDWDWHAYYNYWRGIPKLVQNPGPPIPMKGKGSLGKWGNQNPKGRAPMADPGGKVYQDSGRGLKTNVRCLAKNMPLLNEFTRYGEWGVAAKRWAVMLYNHPLSSGVDYFSNNLGDNKSSLTDRNAAGFLKKGEIGNRRE